MDRRTRVLALQGVFWNPLGLRIIKLGAAFARRWTGVVLNHSAAGETNGEYWLPQLLNAEPLLVDVGFHRGEFAHSVLRARPAARVIGFEPAASLRAIYERSHPPDARISVEPIALSNATGAFEFHDDASGLNSLAPIERSARTVSYSVETTTLDAYAELARIPHIDLLKIDVEGYDLHVLEGASRLLTMQAIDIFVFEYNAPWVLARRYLRDAWQYVNAKPYSLFRLYNGFLAPFEYAYSAERFDLTRMYVGISEQRLARGDIPLRDFPV
jgi:FkbM family methyltransferase